MTPEQKLIEQALQSPTRGSKLPIKPIEYNCRIRVSGVGVTIESEVNGEWKDILLVNSVGVKNTDSKDIKDFALWVNNKLA